MIRLILFSLFISSHVLAQSTVNPEINAFWKEAERQVIEGDFEAYVASFHAEAVLVNGISDQSYPIQTALDNWKQGFDDTKSGKMTAEVEFRFSNQIHSATTAYDTGIFRYAWQNEGEEAQEVFIHLEALLIKSDGDWTILMEYQKSIATVEEWEALE
ncbi:MAG: nuclear transport factor 2 family protein [Balneolaceae bacterium]|nr:nuclear transport factor 2 family protein [Balneolaceae bacterium]